MNERIAGALMVMAGAVAFSGKAIIIKLAYRHQVDPVTLLTLRMLLSAPFFAVLAWWSSRGADVEPISRADLKLVVALGTVGYYLSSYFDFLGLQYITAALERLLLFLNPTFVLLLSAWLFKRRITRRDVLAIALCYTGIVLVFGNDVARQPGNVILGSVLVLLSALLYAIYLLGSGRLVGRLGSVRFACFAGLVSCVGVVAHYAVTQDAMVIFRQAPQVYWLSTLMAVASTVLPIVLTAEGIRRMGASHASMVGSVGPIATIALGYIFLGEPVSAIQLAGAGLVLAGVTTIGLTKGKGA